MSPEILRQAAVRKATGLSRSTLYRQVAAGTFPAPLRLGPRAVGWLRSVVDDWVSSRPQVGEDTKVIGEPPAPKKPRKIGRTRRLHSNGGVQ